jgi:hypothetical protein
VKVETSGDGGVASEPISVPAGGIAQWSPPIESSVGALRWATVTSDVPVVVARSTTLLGPAAAPLRTTKSPIKPPPPTAAERLIAGLPSGYTVSGATPGLAKSWLVGDGESDASEGELILIANPGATTVHLSFTTLSDSGLPSAVSVGPGAARVVSVPATGSGTVIVVTATAPVIVGSGNYARGSRRSVGWSAPGATVVD